MLNDGISIITKAIEAVKPSNLLNQHVVRDENSLIICGEKYLLENRKVKVLCIGKAASAMAVAIEKILGDLLHSGICVTKYGHQLPLSKLETIEAAHPIPDEKSVFAAKKVMDFAITCDQNDLVLVGISGGASSLVLDLPASISLEDMMELYAALTKCGADITEINTVRKQVSVLKGGGLLSMLAQAELVTLAISDVIGDDCSVIGSGLTFPDKSTMQDAMNVLQKYNLWDKISKSIQLHLMNKMDIDHSQNIKDQSVNYHIIGNNHLALLAASNESKELGYNTKIVAENMNCSVDELVNIIIRKILTLNSIEPECYVFGGEPTLNVTGSGIGGRNQHLVLKILEGLMQSQITNDFFITSVGTDGTDGPTDAAGAYVDNILLNKVKESALDVRPFLDQCNSYHFFQIFDGLIKTGPTQTNVMDIITVLIKPK